MTQKAIDLVSSYDAVLLDAYGVLVDAGGPRPGAVELLEALGSKPWRVVTNDASKSPETGAARYQRFGLPIEAKHLWTSGRLLTHDLATHSLLEQTILVLGPPDAHDYVRQAGAHPIGPTDAAEQSFDRIRAIVIGDESGFDFLSGMDLALSVAMDRFDRGLDLDLIVPNPDLIYPIDDRRFGFAAGSMASTLETALEQRFPYAKPRFRRLGKPFPALFEAALDDMGTRNALMIGDQMATDIVGALRAGIDAAWLNSGVGAPPDSQGTQPTFQIHALV